ncbi:MAG: hypothetical protein GY710_09380 [Desulfobacteraceae bacterium]|nr:hypothetical protein [Desulfobacteraceae bacterium]
MSKIDFDKIREAVIEILTQHQMAVGKYGSKKIFDILKKAKSTGFNEMNPGIAIERIKYLEEPSAHPPEQTAKLSLVDFILGMEETQDFSPLISMAAYLNIACYPIPTPKKNLKIVAKNISKITQLANKECTKSFNAVLEALSGDGVVDSKEAEKVSKDCQEAINALCEVKAIVDIIKD